jgi:hypothetical protein
MVGPDPSILRFTAATRYLFLVHTILRSNYSYAPSRQCSMFTFQLYGKGGGGVMVDFFGERWIWPSGELLGGNPSVI